jgi:hypothetical protein
MKVIGTIRPNIIALGCAIFVLALFPDLPITNRIAAMLGLYLALIFTGSIWDMKP